MLDVGGGWRLFGDVGGEGVKVVRGGWRRLEDVGRRWRRLEVVGGCWGRLEVVWGCWGRGGGANIHPPIRQLIPSELYSPEVRMRIYIVWRRWRRLEVVGGG